MREIGVVIEAYENTAKVAVLRRSACGENCASCKGGCRPAKSIITAKNKIGARGGCRVVLEIPDKRALSAAALVYILPLAAFIAGGAVGIISKLSEGLSALLGFLAMILCFAVVRFVSERRKMNYEVQITQILTKNDNMI